MVAKNDITGDSIQTKMPSDAYRNNFEKIFGKSPLDIKREREMSEQQFKKEYEGNFVNED